MVEHIGRSSVAALFCVQISQMRRLRDFHRGAPRVHLACPTRENVDTEMKACVWMTRGPDRHSVMDG